MLRPAEEWQTIDRPELRIVDDALWTTVQTRLRSPRRIGGSVGAGPKPRTLLGGLLRCGRCGGSIIAVDAHQYGCAARKDRGPSVCKGLRASRQTVETRVFSVVRDELLSPEAVTKMQARVRSALAEQSKNSVLRDVQRRARRTELDRKIANLLDAIEEVGIWPALRQRLLEAESEREQLKSGSEARDRPVALPVDLLVRYKRAIADLRGALSRDPASSREILRDLLGEIHLQPEGDEIYAEFEARPERILLSGRAASNFGCGDPIPT